MGKRQPLREIRDIPRLRSRERRAAELFVDCYGDAEAAGSLHVYLSDALDYPFPAQRRNGRRRIPLVVLELADYGPMSTKRNNTGWEKLWPDPYRPDGACYRFTTPSVDCAVR